MEWVIKAGGVYCIMLIIFHLLFWNIFHWNTELPKLNSLNRSIMQVLNISLTFVFAIFAYVSLTHSDALLTTPLGRALLVLIALFWFLRAVQQIIFFKLQHRLSWGFLFFFLLGAVIYAVPLVGTTR